MRHADKLSRDNLFYEWATGVPVVLVRDWCSVNGRIVGQLSWYGIGAL
jgi:hypothetical protein